MVKLLVICNMKLVRWYENWIVYGNVKVKVLGMVVELFVCLLGMFIFLFIFIDINDSFVNIIFFIGFGFCVLYCIFEMCCVVGFYDFVFSMFCFKNLMNFVKVVY